LYNGVVRRDALFANEGRAKMVSDGGGGIDAVFQANRREGSLLRLGHHADHLRNLDARARWSALPYYFNHSLAFLPSDPELFGEPRRFEDMISRVIASGRRGKLIELLRPLLPQIADIRVLTITGEPVLYIEEAGEKLWPAASLGDGTKRLMGLAAVMALDAPLRLVEEPEAHHHPASARQAARLLWDAVEGNKQTFVTTHSVPLLAELLDNTNGREDSLRVLLLSRDNGVVTAKSLSAEQARAPGHRNKILQALDPRWPG
jgi:hypothetical protein